MQLIESFKKNLNDPLFTGRKKELVKAGWGRQRLCNISYFDDTRLLSIATTFIKILDQFEKNKNEYNQLTEETFNDLKKLQLSVIKQLKGLEYKSSKDSAAEINSKIAWRINSLGRKKGFIKEANQENLQENIEKKINAWRTRTIGKTPDSKAILFTAILEDGSSLERTAAAVDLRVQKVAEELARYPSFVELMNDHPELFELAMDWSVRDNLPINLFVEMPRGYQWIKKYMLATRVSLFFRETIKTEKDTVEKILVTDKETGYKEMQLPFQGKWHHIHTSSKTSVTLGTDKKCTTTFDAIKKCFRGKWVNSGDFEFLPQVGFTNWNPYKLARLVDDIENERKHKYENIDFTQKNWIEQLPKIEKISKEEAEQRYKKNVVEGGRDILASRSSRANLENKMEVMKTHAWLEYAKKNEDDTYTVYDFGSYPENYPYTLWGLLSFTGNTAKGVITAFEENILYTHRQHKIEAKAMDKEKDEVFLKTMGTYLQAAQQGLWSFQFLFHGCAMLVESLFTKVFPEEDFTSWFRVNIIDANPSGPLRYFVLFLWAQPKALRYYALLGLAIMLGGWRGRDTLDVRENEVDIKKIRRVSLWNLCDREMKLFHPGNRF